jgi:hypothetical protein
MIGAMLGVASLAIRPQATDVARERTFGALVRGARTKALREGRAVSLQVSFDSRLIELTVLSSGSVVYGSAPPPDSAEVPVRWEVRGNDPR